MRAIASANAVAATDAPLWVCPVWPSGLLEHLFYNLGRSAGAVNTAKNIGVFALSRRPATAGRWALSGPVDVDLSEREIPTGCPVTEGQLFVDDLGHPVPQQEHPHVTIELRDHGVAAGVRRHGVAAHAHGRDARPEAIDRLEPLDRRVQILEELRGDLTTIDRAQPARARALIGTAFQRP